MKFKRQSLTESTVKSPIIYLDETTGKQYRVIDGELVELEGGKGGPPEFSPEFPPDFSPELPPETPPENPPGNPPGNPPKPSENPPKNLPEFPPENSPKNPPKNPPEAPKPKYKPGKIYNDIKTGKRYRADAWGMRLQEI